MVVSVASQYLEANRLPMGAPRGTKQYLEPIDRTMP